MPLTEIHSPTELQSLLELMRLYPKSLLFAGGSDILRGQAARALRLPETLISLRGVSELRRSSLTERFLEIGSMVTLAELLDLGENALPPLLAETLQKTANPAIRNLATVGGNLAARERFMDLWPALACLESLVELRDKGGSSWINVNRLRVPDGSPGFPGGALITRIRVPVEKWDFISLKKVGNRGYPAPDSAVFALVARAEKGILSEFRLAFAGERALRLRELETALLGRRLPLAAKDIALIAQNYKDAASALFNADMALGFTALVNGALRSFSR